MGMLHGDGNTRQCMATAVVAYQESFGFDAPPFTYEDFEQSDVLVFVGSNVCIAHPIMWERVMRNPHNPEIVVIDPRATETAMAATQHLPVRPKSDLTLLYGLARLLVERRLDLPGVYRRAHQRLRSVSSSFSMPFRSSASWRKPGSPPQESNGWPARSTKAAAFRSGGRWASTKAIRVCARRRP